MLLLTLKRKDLLHFFVVEGHKFYIFTTILLSKKYYFRIIKTYVVFELVS